MSRCSKKCNELKEKINNISGLDDDYIFEILSKIENQIDLINKYADEDDLNGTCFKNCNMSKSNADEKRKIIEIYVTENEETDSVSFEFEKMEDTEVANATMKGLLMIFANYKDDEDELEVEYE